MEAGRAFRLQESSLAAALHPPAVDVDSAALRYDERCKAQLRHDVDHGCRHSRVAEVNLLEACLDQGSKTGRPKPPMKMLLLPEEA